MPNPFMFAGQWYDNEISQYYMRARQYDPHIGRLTARDPAFGGPKNVPPLTLLFYHIPPPKFKKKPRLSRENTHLLRIS
jgi:RHS repeat-associated protein